MNVTDTRKQNIKPFTHSRTGSRGKPSEIASLGRDSFQRSKASTVVGSRPNVFPHQANGLWAGLHNQEFMENPGFAEILPPSSRNLTDLNRETLTGDDIPAFFKHLHAVAKGRHVYLDIDSHGGGGNGVIFTESDPQHPNTRVLNAYSIAYINQALVDAGFKPEDVTVFYEGCNTATAAYRTSQGFTRAGERNLEEKEGRWQREDDPKTQHVVFHFHDVPASERGHVVEFPAVGRMDENTLSVQMQFRLGKAQLIPGDWTTGIYWIDHQKKAPRYLESSGGLKKAWANHHELFDQYEALARKESSTTHPSSSHG